MLYREFAPSPVLAHGVKCLWILEAEPGLAPQTIVPDGCTEIVFQYGDHFHSQPRTVFAGQIERPFRIVPLGRTGTLGVRFHPGGARHFFNESQAEFTGEIHSLEDIWGSAGRSLEERVLHATCTPDRIAAVESALIEKRIERDSTPVACAALHLIRTARGTQPIREISLALHVSPRHLERVFQREVGLNPKLFSRIVRFQHVLRALDQRKDSWCSIAQDCGYFDQPHLIREFEEFTGQTPAAYTVAGSEMSVAFLQDNPAPRV